MTRRKWVLVAAVVVGCCAVYLGWRSLRPKKLPDGFASGNGRIEAVEIDVATKTAGRLKEMLANEGDFVAADQVLARMDTDVLAAQVREAEADLRRARSAVDTAKSSVRQRESEKSAGESLVAQREAELDGAVHRAGLVREHDEVATGVERDAFRRPAAAPVRDRWHPVRQGCEGRRRPPDGVRFQRLPAREHEHHERARQVLAQDDGGNDRDAGEQVRTELPAHQPREQLE